MNTKIESILICMGIVVITYLIAYYQTFRKRRTLNRNLLIFAIIKYRTECYMNDIEPAFNVDCIIEAPPWKASYKYMLPKEFYPIIKPYMEALL